MKPKRSLGQNFFVNSNLGEYIVNTISKIGGECVVEIGPGMGFFTKRLVNIFNNVTVIEKDDELASNLKTQFPTVNVINSDFLDFDLNTLNSECIYFGSLPYNVSKPIIRKLLQSDSFQKPSLFIVQKEVAEKYIYKKPYSMLSLTTKIYADSKKILDISPQSFRPRPRVNSSLILFTPNIKVNTDLKSLEQLITLSFRQPRKNLFNNLKGTVFEKGCISYKTQRASNLDLEKYIDILNHSL